MPRYKKAEPKPASCTGCLYFTASRLIVGLLLLMLIVNGGPAIVGLALVIIPVACFFFLI